MIRTLIAALAVAACSSMEMPSAGGSSGSNGNGGTSGTGSGGSGGTTGSNQLDIYQSGSRIKMRVGTTPDGAKTFIGWRDTQRNEDCQFSYKMTDGLIHCEPISAANPFYAYNAFADAQCTTPLALVPSCAMPPKYGYSIVYPSGNNCGDYTFHLYNLGAAYTGTGLYQKSGTSCTATQRDQSYTYFAIGAEIPASDLQSMTESVE